jgi:phosphate starvation-inducible PhoH-like protein
VQLDEADVVRHRLVKMIIRAYDKEQVREEELEEKRSNRL